MSQPAMDCGREVLEVVPLVMQTIRAEMRRHSAPGLSVPQLRTLAYLNRHGGASLGDVAEHIGLSLPSMSKLIEGLVARKLVTREADAKDRRRVQLGLTARGQELLAAARQATVVRLAALLGGLSAQEQERLRGVLELLRTRFSPRHEAPAPDGGG